MQLQSVLEYKAQRAAEIKTRDEISLLPPSPASTPTALPVPADIETTAISNLNPAELNQLQLPENFKFINNSGLQSSALREKTEKLFAPVSTGWQKMDSDLLVLISKTPVDAEKLSFMTKKNFLEELKNTGKEYDTYYQKTYHVPALFEMREEKNLTLMKITSKYPEGGVWKTDLRYIYFYNPSYRLNLLITGSDEDLALSWKDLEPRLKSFERTLDSQYAEPIPFQKDLEEI